MSIRDHVIVTMDVVIEPLIGAVYTKSYSGLFPSVEYAKTWLKEYLKREKSHDIIAIRTMHPSACIIAHNY